MTTWKMLIGAALIAAASHFTGYHYGYQRGFHEGVNGTVDFVLELFGTLKDDSDALCCRHYHSVKSDITTYTTMSPVQKSQGALP